MTRQRAERHRIASHPKRSRDTTAPPSSGALLHLSIPFEALLWPHQQPSATGADSDSVTRILRAKETERLWWTTDPRWSDLPEDREMWMVLLTWAYEVDSQAPDGLFGTLHGLRCLGARLERHPSGIRIRPGDIESSDYFVLRKRYLQPWSSVIKQLLSELAAEMQMRSMKHAHLR